jgi:hypothetical protein
LLERGRPDHLALERSRKLAGCRSQLLRYSEKFIGVY